MPSSSQPSNGIHWNHGHTMFGGKGQNKSQNEDEKAKENTVWKFSLSLRLLFSVSTLNSENLKISSLLAVLLILLHMKIKLNN